MSNIGLLPLLLFFSLTHHTLDVPPSWFCLLSTGIHLTCTSLLFSYTLSPISSFFFLTLALSPLTYLDPWLLLDIIFLCFHLLDAAPPPVTGMPPHSPAAPVAWLPLLGAVLCWRGLEWEFKGVAGGTDCTAVQTSGWPESTHWPIGHVTHAAAHVAKTRVWVGHVCLHRVWMRSYVAYRHRWAQRGLNKTEAVTSLLLPNTKRKCLLTVATHASTCLFISTKRCFLFVFFKSHNEPRPTRTNIPALAASQSARARHYTHRQKHWRILIWATGQTQLNHPPIIWGYWIQRRRRRGRKK